MLRFWFIPSFSINGSYTEVNKLGIWELSTISRLRYLRDNFGQVETTPDRMAWLLLAALLFHFHDKWPDLALHSLFLDVRTTCKPSRSLG
ncbi:hypothetical protein X739_31680 [Mesorhizobium sp. LNHC220B00]|nr:hypothetical protein X748_29430 [Mesorhizobium sp. LNJC386A00]ESY78534.1 hypothetical protein X739_31680 [Mesorhizobium sp. LNHC220B00]